LWVVVYYNSTGLNLLLWPALVVLLMLLSLGLAVLRGTQCQVSGHQYALPFVIQLLMFTTPIIYPASMVPERFQWLLALNPLSGLIEAFRYVWSQAMLSTEPAGTLRRQAREFFSPQVWLTSRARRKAMADLV